VQSPHPLGLDCVVQNGVQFCQGDGAAKRVPSFDGVPLDVDVTLPSADQGPGPFPTIVMLHGYGGSKLDFESDSPDGNPDSSTPGRLYHWNNVWFARRGYAVVNYTARGFGKSCGSQDSRTPDCHQQLNNGGDPSADGWIHLKDRRREAHDTQHLLGLLVDEDIAKPDALGATGISYGGGESIELAYLKDRIQKVGTDPAAFEPWVSPVKKIPMKLSAAFPRWPWSDLVSSLTPNGRFLDYDNATAGLSRTPPGVPIQTYIAGLFVTGASSGQYAPPGVDMTADLSNWNTRVAAGEPYSDPYAQQILNEIHDFHQGFDTPGSDPAPLLIQNGWTDDLFPPAEALRVYNSMRAGNPNADIALQFGDLGHSRGSNKANADRTFNDQATYFFDKHLKGSSETPPPAPGSVTAFTQTCPKPADAGGPFTAGSWPGLHPGAVRFAFANPATVTSAGGNPETGQAFDPISGTSDSCKQVDDETADGAATYRLPASKGFTMMGLPTVSAEIETTGVNGQLDSRLWDVAPDGKQTLVSRGVYRLDDNQTTEPGKPLKFQLHGNAWVFAAGHVPKLELLGQDAPYLRPSNGAFQISVKNVVIELPQLEPPTSNAQFGQGVQPVLGVGGTIPVAPAKTKPKLRISVSPRKTRAGKRTRFVFRVRARSAKTGKLVNVRKARVRFAGKKLRTGKHGRARMRVRFKKRGPRRASTTKAGYRKGTVRVRVLTRRRR
jgi:predicted acyl esterase